MAKSSTTLTESTTRNFGHSPFEFDGNHMTITATKTPEHLRASANWQPYLSGALTTYNKFKMKYGYVEMRAQLPKGKGLWSAFWLLHQNDNDRRPEIDVVEYIGNQQRQGLQHLSLLRELELTFISII